MQITFAIIAAFTVVSAIAAMSLRKLVHCALAAAITFAGLAALFLQLGAPFVGWTQVLVYIGAVAILIVFAILLTHGDHSRAFGLSKTWTIGVGVSVLVFGLLTYAILHSPVAGQLPSVKPEPTVRDLGIQLMTRYVLPLETIALLLTAAAIGAVIIALRSPKAPLPEMNHPAAAVPVSPKIEPVEHHAH